MDKEIDSVKLNFSSDSLIILDICLAIIMFGVALNLHLDDFKNIIKHPKPVMLGIFSQFLVLPAITYLVVIVMQPSASLALGMMLVAACPGGNISNFMSQMAGGNAALSVSLTAFSSFMAIIFTPLNLQFWGSLYAPTDGLLRQVSLNPMDVFSTVAVILGIPLILGMLVNHKKPQIAETLVTYLRPLSILIFAGFVIIAFSNNMNIFLKYIQVILLLVLFHNAVALVTGYSIGYLGRLSRSDCKTLSIETGIQNSGLGLLLIFSYFDGLGGMAIIAGWWGIWHIISGLTLASVWSEKSFIRSPVS